MLKNQRQVIIGLALLTLFFTTASANASVVCNKYKEHKKEFKTEENKEIYLKIRWIKNHQEDTYAYYRALCEPYKFNHALFTGNLNKTCHDYYIYEEYADYLDYKKQCHRHDDDDESVIPEPEPEPDPQ